jgi:hypothetical protein
MQTMTLNEYLNYALIKALAERAQREGIEIVERPQPRLVRLRQEPNPADDAAA